MSVALIVAAGRGSRVGATVPKQYLPLLGRPLLLHSLDLFAAHPAIDRLVLVLAADDEHWPVLRWHCRKPLHLAVGGATRAESVRAGLRALPAQVTHDTLVCVHDAARPCLDPIDLDRVLAAAASSTDGALLAAPVRDTLKRAAGARAQATVDRKELWRALTPQVFARGSLERALDAAVEAGVEVTDEAMALERLGRAPCLVEGREDNLKITTAADFALAEFVLRQRENRP